MDWKGKGLNKMKESERFMFFLARARMPCKKCFRRRLKRKVENAMDSEEQENKKRNRREGEGDWVCIFC